MSLPAVLTLAEICGVLRVAPKTVYRLVARGKLRRVAGIRHVRVTRTALEAFLSGE
ncbi:MAG: helix-turn-helix domain-containing protein [Limisphaerales bacterium]